MNKNSKKIILFSPIGMSDPIKNNYDGPLLHICRYYKPDKIYLFMSKEICCLHNKDNRYIKCIEKLASYLEAKGVDWKYDIELIEKVDFKEVNSFEITFKYLKDEIFKVIDDNKMNDHDELLLNVTSGTPQMESALIVINNLLDINCKAIRVNSPFNKSNSGNEDFDIDEEWGKNFDNNKSAERRCPEVKTPTLINVKYFELIKKQLNDFNYHNALECLSLFKCDEEKNSCSKSLIEYAINRSSLKTDLAIEDQKTLGLNYIDKQYANFELFEHLLVLRQKCLKRDYSGFFMGLTPSFIKLLYLLCNNICKEDISKYIDTQSDNISKWSQRKLKKTPVGKCIYSILSNTYSNWNPGFHFVKSNDLVSIINLLLIKEDDEFKSKIINQDLLDGIEYVKKIDTDNNTPVTFKNIINNLANLDKELTILKPTLTNKIFDEERCKIIEYINDLRNIEINIRNRLAHAIAPFNEEYISTAINKEPYKIFEMLQWLADFVGVKDYNSKDWCSFEDLNELILKTINL